MKTCRKCKEEKPLSAFYKQKEGRQGITARCKQCASDARTIYTSNKVLSDPLYHKKRSVKAKYKLEWQDYLDLIKVGCPCGSTKNLHVDHNHSCCPGVYSCGKCVRGVLCRECNRSIGLVKESPNTLRNLAEYIEKWR